MVNLEHVIRGPGGADLADPSAGLQRLDRGAHVLPVHPHGRVQMRLRGVHRPVTWLWHMNRAIATFFVLAINILSASIFLSYSSFSAIFAGTFACTFLIFDI
jgi:hypothetical protein